MDIADFAPSVRPHRMTIISMIHKVYQPAFKRVQWVLMDYRCASALELFSFSRPQEDKRRDGETFRDLCFDMI